MKVVLTNKIKNFMGNCIKLSPQLRVGKLDVTKINECRTILIGALPLNISKENEEELFCRSIRNSLRYCKENQIYNILIDLSDQIYVSYIVNLIVNEVEEFSKNSRATDFNKGNRLESIVNYMTLKINIPKLKDNSLIEKCNEVLQNVQRVPEEVEPKKIETIREQVFIRKGYSFSECNEHICYMRSMERNNEKGLRKFNDAKAKEEILKQFEEFSDAHKSHVTLKTYIEKLLEEKGISKGDRPKVYKGGGLSKNTFSKIVKNDSDYKPSKRVLGALAVGLKLNIKETEKLYHEAGYHLGEAETTDLVIRFFTSKGIYDIELINICLIAKGEPLLGDGRGFGCNNSNFIDITARIDAF